MAPKELIKLILKIFLIVCGQVIHHAGQAGSAGKGAGISGVSGIGLVKPDAADIDGGDGSDEQDSQDDDQKGSDLALDTPASFKRPVILKPGKKHLPPYFKYGTSLSSSARGEKPYEAPGESEPAEMRVAL